MIFFNKRYLTRIPDSNFSLQQACQKFDMTRVQACSKLTKASKSSWNELAVSLQCTFIANYSRNRVRARLGIELATCRLVARRKIPLRQLDYERRR
ncbi:hypothetical protein AVEN_43963-1 [Araneus ventricosus]|uniref:Uncharacterized protein n=1 Tax=Araneus ventricosus TaxID=182803 RepID=A0A4Y2KNS1_ARAVE|nr:hypothetical protein AVEN_43963-1 [Araneus ventricosus]